MKDEVIISQGNRPFWHNIIAAFLYTVAVACILLFFYGLEFSFERQYVEREMGYIKVAGLALAGAFYYSVIQTDYFDFKKNVYKHERAFLWFKLGKWNPLPELQYISVFQKEEGIFEINLWYIGNKHFNIYSMYDEAAAMETGKQLAKSLQIDLLDATIANDSKWVEL
ncbi:hypothetical protein [uncultured Kordia sp.]|uniref:hypothetical protein n=1 Tax=uncultured Kordia sp. TaxID=507699 RepID=UPI00261D146A|nr:hypothetical protein [uncultured Kordia sp.]